MRAANDSTGQVGKQAPQHHHMGHAAADSGLLSHVYVALLAGNIFERLQNLWCGSREGTWRVRGWHQLHQEGA